VGSVSHYLGLKGVEETAFDFKSVTDAIRIRSHVLDMLELADREPDSARRRAMLTFVVAGAGFAGAELAGALNDFVRGALVSYPDLAPDDVQIVVVHPRNSILPELSPSLAQYALEHMKARGVTFKLNTRLVEAQEGVVRLSPAEEIRAETLIWTAGVKPLFPGRPGAKVAWEGRREPRRQPISWTDPMMWLKVLPPDEPDVLVCVRGVVLACA